MENLKKNPLSLQLNVEDFAPASNDEKKSLVVMRESVNPADRLHGLCSAQLLALQL